MYKNENASEELAWLPSWSPALLDLWSNTLPPIKYEAGVVLRQTIRLTAGGSRLKLGLSNLFGKLPLDIEQAHLARPESAEVNSRIDAASDTVVTFGGSCAVTIPAGETIMSDEIDFAADTREQLVITIKLGASVPYAPAEYSSQVTGHGGGRTTTFICSGADAGDTELFNAQTTEAWYYIANIDVLADKSIRTIVCLGDSITDGRGARTNFDTRWTDFLSNSLEAGSERGKYAVINKGMGGNSICHGGIGPDMAIRFDRDVLGLASVEYLVILAGINDIGGISDERELEARLGRAQAEYGAFIRKADAAGIKVYGCTLTPMKGNEYFNPSAEKYRCLFNGWIRSGCDGAPLNGIIDFEAVIADKTDPERALPLFITDGLHPSPEGYEQMGAAVYNALFSD